jgi:hypothetical protein
MKYSKPKRAITPYKYSDDLIYGVYYHFLQYFSYIIHGDQF